MSKDKVTEPYGVDMARKAVDVRLKGGENPWASAIDAAAVLAFYLNLMRNTVLDSVSSPDRESIDQTLDIIEHRWQVAVETRQADAKRKR